MMFRKKGLIAFALGLIGTTASAQSAPPFDTEKLLGRIEAGMATIFDRVDLNRDGFIAPDEAREFAKRSGLAGNGVMNGESWSRADVNRDGHVSRAEFAAAIRQHLRAPSEVYRQNRTR